MIPIPLEVVCGGKSILLNMVYLQSVTPELGQTILRMHGVTGSYVIEEEYTHFTQRLGHTIKELTGAML